MPGSGKADPDDGNADSIAQHLAARGEKTSLADRRDRVIEIPPDEQDVVALFIALQTQWRIHAMTGVATGLFYEAVPPTAALCGIATTPGLFADLQTMERAALKEMARKS